MSRKISDSRRVRLGRGPCRNVCRARCEMSFLGSQISPANSDRIAFSRVSSVALYGTTPQHPCRKKYSNEEELLFSERRRTCTPVGPIRSRNPTIGTCGNCSSATTRMAGIRRRHRARSSAEFFEARVRINSEEIASSCRSDRSLLQMSPAGSRQTMAGRLSDA